MNALEGLVSSFTNEQKLEAKQIEEKIEEVANKIIEGKKALDGNFVQLGQLINEVRDKKYWLLGEYKTFGDYIQDCEKKFSLKHSQLYVGMRVTRNLLPSVSEEDLIDIGITKASVLSKYVEQSGNTKIPDKILDTAKTSSYDELEATVNSSLHNVVPEKGKWFSLGGFFASDDEKKEILDALTLAKSIDPQIPNNIPQWQQDKEAYLRLAREFLGSY